MIAQIEEAATAVGIQAFVTNSKERIETQLNSLTKRDVDVPIMLINWDINTNVEFDSNGFLKNPSSTIVTLLLTKKDELTKDKFEQGAVEMGALFQTYLQTLYPLLIPFQRDNATPPITGATYKDVPKYGAGKHSGILGRFTVRGQIANC